MSIGVIAAHAAASGGSGGAFATLMASKSPAAWYRLGEASGTTMNDSSGNSRNGAYSTGGGFAPPTLGATGLLHDGDTDTAASFNGTTSACEVTYNSGWMNNTTFSVFARIKPNTVSGNHSVVGRYVGVGGNVNAWIIRQDGPTVYLWYNNGSNYFNLTLGTVASGTEYTVGVSVGGGVIKVYFNGAMVASRTDSIRATTANIIVGANYQGSPNELFSGVIDEVAYWNATLADADQADLHAAAA